MWVDGGLCVILIGDYKGEKQGTHAIFVELVHCLQLYASSDQGGDVDGELAPLACPAAVCES